MGYEFKGTKGPWFVKTDGWKTRGLVSSEKHWIADLTLFHDTAEANARAISQVPGLIKEGANLVAVLKGEGGTDPDALERFEEILRKATGG